MPLRTVILATSLALASPCAAALPQGAPDTRHVTATVDPRIELMSVIFRLAGSPEYSQGKIASYAEAADAHFAEFREHPVVERARDLRRRRGVGYDAVVSIALHTTDTETLGELVPLDPRPAGLDERWTPAEARAFLADARRFARDARFAEFFGEHEALYALACERMQALLDGEAEIGWFDAFFGARPAARFVLALGMLNGGASYGPRVFWPDGREDLHAIIGVWLTEDGLPVFDLSVLGTVVHEFGHSYCNHLVEAHLKELRGASERLWPAVASRMQRQAYGSWDTMMTESLVRACVGRYMSATRGEPAGRAEIAAQEALGFLWTGALSDVLAEYEAERDEYPSLEAFFPRIILFFDEYASAFDARAHTPPVVTSLVPANGAQDVDPALAAIVVTFDRPMRDGGWAFVGGGPKFPKTTGKPGYDETRMTATLPVALEPEHDYELWLNRGRYSSFQSAEGVPLESIHFRFRTGGKR